MNVFKLFLWIISSGNSDIVSNIPHVSTRYFGKNHFVRGAKGFHSVIIQANFIAVLYENCIFTTISFAGIRIDKTMVKMHSQNLGFCNDYSRLQWKL